MGGSRRIDGGRDNESYYYQGDLSRPSSSEQPAWLGGVHAGRPNLSIALMEDWESKIEEMAAVTMQHDVTSISGVPSWALLLLQEDPGE
ncbi:MAG: hypothetical protein MZV63_06440 [Marinilabiliales bacterium]|nr:hypothetical protein [Marinilabiliales bacterium]